MKFVIAGASGFLGRALTEHLTSSGHEVTRLVRGAAGTGESRWDPYAGKVDLDLIEAADVVANVAGANIAHWPWNASYVKTFADSRIVTTRTLADAIVGLHKKPVFVAQNGVAGYGDHGADVVTEDDPTDATTLLGRITQEWQAATDPARNAGARVVVLRTAVVVDKRGSALKAMMLPFKLGLGGPLGSGDQYFPTISLEDWLRAATYLAESESASGAYNLVGPGTATNEEFTNALAGKLHRPSFVRVPAWPVKMAFRPVASEFLGSIRLEPKRLLDAGFRFNHATLEARLEAALR